VTARAGGASLSELALLLRLRVTASWLVLGGAAVGLAARSLG